METMPLGSLLTQSRSFRYIEAKDLFVRDHELGTHLSRESGCRTANAYVRVTKKRAFVRLIRLRNSCRHEVN